MFANVWIHPPPAQPPAQAPGPAYGPTSARERCFGLTSGTSGGRGSEPWCGSAFGLSAHTAGPGESDSFARGFASGSGSAGFGSFGGFGGGGGLDLPVGRRWGSTAASAAASWETSSLSASFNASTATGPCYHSEINAPLGRAVGWPR